MWISLPPNQQFMHTPLGEPGAMCAAVMALLVKATNSGVVQVGC